MFGSSRVRKHDKDGDKSDEVGYSIPHADFTLKTVNSQDDDMEAPGCFGVQNKSRKLRDRKVTNVFE